jgi:predicted GNAT family N-acyltransferase
VTEFSILGVVERAAWNAELEQSLVDLLFEHNLPPYRAQNGWSLDAWNKIVAEFHKKHEYVTFNRIQIQEKGRKLKREYKMLKEARKQSGASWDEKRCMIIAEPPIWDNIIDVSFSCC